jgi:hypothetical protein
MFLNLFSRQKNESILPDRAEGDRFFRKVTLINLGLGIFNSFLLLVLGSTLRLVATRPLPNFVQLADGRSVTVGPVDPLFRDSRAIEKFVSQILYLLFTWSSQIAEGQAEDRVVSADEGVEVAPGLRVTKPTWEASFALSEDFREEFLKGIAQMMPSDIWAGKSYVSLKFIDIGEPTLVRPGYWEVKVVANLIIQDGKSPQGRSIPFNKIISVRAVDNPPLPPGEGATSLQKTIYNVRVGRLEIHEIRDFTKSD